MPDPEHIKFLSEGILGDNDKAGSEADLPSLRSTGTRFKGFMAARVEMPQQDDRGYSLRWRGPFSATEREIIGDRTQLSFMTVGPDDCLLGILERGVEAWNLWRKENLSVLRPCLDGADLSGMTLNEADMRGVTFRNANLYSADLSNSDLSYADFTYADLRNARLLNANLFMVNLIGTKMAGVDVSKSLLGSANIGDCDLSEVKGLDTLVHLAGSMLSIDTIYKSGGNVTEAFLRGCGVPDAFINYVHSLVKAGQPIDFYSCFISYSSTDQEFADRFHADLQAQGVRVWFAPHDMKIGARIRPTIDESIRVYDKLLLVLSEASVSSQWVEQEVETALAREREQEGKTVLFPIRLDDTVMESKAGWPALLKNTRNVGDFTCWKNHDSYQKAFNRLLRDLKAEA